MTPGGVTDPAADEDEDHQASQPKPFSDEEKAWGAILHTTGKYFTPHAAKYPPRNDNLYQFALALGLVPNASGALFADRRAKRLLLLIEAMQQSERAFYEALARQQMDIWLATRQPAEEETRGGSERQAQMTLPETPSEPGVVRPWRLPDVRVLPPLRVEDTQVLALQEARLKEEVAQAAQKLQQTCDSLNVKVDVKPEDISIGPTVIRFGIRPTGKPTMKQDEKGRLVPLRDGAGNVIYESRTRVSRIMALQNDLALALEARSIRMQAPVPGRPFVGVEIPNKNSRLVTLREILESKEYASAKARSKLTLALGRDVAGAVRIGDLSQMPHLLIAGATGSGKSVALNAIIGSFLTQATPDDVRMLMVDPKMVELNMYNGIPHLLSPVVTEVDQVVGLLKIAIAEMETRYRLFSQLNVRNLDGYRKLRSERLKQGDSTLKNLPAIVIIIDELADLMMVAQEEVEGLICRLAQLARATGIHLIIATQRPSVDVITGLIKANIPTRISFMVSSQVDSRTIIDIGGAERLLGRGDMLYLPVDASQPERIQGAFVADDEAERLVAYWKEEQVRHASGAADDALQTEGLIQLSLGESWSVPHVEGEKAGSRVKAKEGALSAQQLAEYLTSYLLHGQITVNGAPIDAPIPVPLRSLEREDQVLVAEAVTWQGHRGSAETLNRKLKTKQGAELRDILINRGLMDATTQQPVRPSDRLTPLLVECGILQDAAEESVEGDVEEKSPGDPLPPSVELSTL